MMTVNPLYRLKYSNQYLHTRKYRLLCFAELIKPYFKIDYSDPEMQTIKTQLAAIDWAALPDAEVPREVQLDLHQKITEFKQHNYYRIVQHYITNNIVKAICGFGDFVAHGSILPGYRAIWMNPGRNIPELLSKSHLAPALYGHQSYPNYYMSLLLKYSELERIALTLAEREMCSPPTLKKTTCGDFIL
jgi:hypothetical protein